MNLGIYIQVPFCRTKCTYCNFHTGVFSKGLYSPYADAVIREIGEHERLYRAAGLTPQYAQGCTANLVVDTVYIGEERPASSNHRFSPECSMRCAVRLPARSRK